MIENLIVAIPTAYSRKAIKFLIESYKKTHIKLQSESTTVRTVGTTICGVILIISIIILLALSAIVSALL